MNSDNDVVNNINKHNAFEKEYLNNIRHICKHLFSFGKLKIKLIPDSENPLNAVASYVAKFYNIENFTINTDFAKTVESKNSENKLLENIKLLKTSAAAIDAFLFSISLRKDDWIKKEFKPLIAFSKDGKIPYALVRTKSRGIAINGTNGEIITITKEFIETIDSIGWYFFEKLPDKPLTIFDYLMQVFSNVKSNMVNFTILHLIVNGLYSMLCPLLNYIIFSEILPNANKQLLGNFLITTCIASVTVFISFYIISDLPMILGTSLQRKSILLIFERLMRLPLSFFKKHTVGELSAKIVALQGIYIYFVDIIMALTGLGTGIYIFSLGYTHALILFAVLIVVVSIEIFCILNAKRKMPDERHKANLSQGIVVQLLTGITKLKTAGAEFAAINMWLEKFADQKEVYKSYSFENKVPNIIKNILPSIIFTAIAGFTTHSIYKGENINISDFAMIISAAGLFGTFFSNFCISTISTMEEFAVLKQIAPILEAIPEKIDYSQSQIQDPQGKLEIHNLKFSYDGNKNVLDGISITANPGELVAFVGKSGCGKSTLFRLIMGFEVPSEGSIAFDDVDIQNLNLAYLRSRMGIVLQSAELFPDTILRNIIGYSIELTEEDAWEAAKKAGCEEDIRALPLQMHTVINNKSVISGGQRQRIALARALAKNPKIILMDEATSALDNKTQKTVTDYLMSSSATKLTIAHRLSTIINADRIYVLDNGKIVEEGNYKELMANNGYFAAMAKRQIA